MIKQTVGYVLGFFALGLMAAPTQLYAQTEGGPIIVNVSLSTSNISAGAEALLITCEVTSRITPPARGHSNIGVGHQLYYFGSSERLQEIERTYRDDESFAYIAETITLTGAARDELPDNVQVHVRQISVVPLDAWTSGECFIRLFSTERAETDFEEVFFPSAYDIVRACDEGTSVDRFSIFRCAVGDTISTSRSTFVRPGFEAADDQ